MPRMINELSPEEKIKVFHVINALSVIKPKATAIDAAWNIYKEQLSRISTKEAFFDLVHQLTVTQSEIQALLKPILHTLSPELNQCVKAHFESSVDVDPIATLLNFSNLLGTCIIATKERLSESEVYAALPIEQQVIARSFIQQVKALEPIVKEILEYKKSWQQQLHNADSEDEVARIDEDIAVKSRIYAETYHLLITFPEDEGTSGALIKHLETNRHLHALMKAFNFHASLNDDILSARARLYRPIPSI